LCSSSPEVCGVEKIPFCSAPDTSVHTQPLRSSSGNSAAAKRASLRTLPSIYRQAQSIVPLSQQSQFCAVTLNFSA